MTKVLVMKGARASVSMCARESVFIRPNIKLWTLMRSMCPVAFPLPFLIAAGTHNRPGQGASRLTHDALTPLPLPPFEAAQHHYLMAQMCIKIPSLPLRMVFRTCLAVPLAWIVCLRTVGAPDLPGSGALVTNAS